MLDVAFRSSPIPPNPIHPNPIHPNPIHPKPILQQTGPAPFARPAERGGIVPDSGRAKGFAQGPQTAAGLRANGLAEAKGAPARFAEDLEQATAAREAREEARNGRSDRKAKAAQSKEDPGVGDEPRAVVTPAPPIWNPIWYALPPISLLEAAAVPPVGGPEVAPGLADSSARASAHPASGDQLSADAKILPEEVLAPGMVLVTPPLTEAPGAPAVASAPAVSVAQGPWPATAQPMAVPPAEVELVELPATARPLALSPVPGPRLAPAVEDEPATERLELAPSGLDPGLKSLLSSPEAPPTLANPNPDRSPEPRGAPSSLDAGPTAADRFSSAGPPDSRMALGITKAGWLALLPLAFSARLDPVPGVAEAPEVPEVPELVAVAERGQGAGAAAPALLPALLSGLAREDARPSDGLAPSEPLPIASPVATFPAAEGGEAGPDSGARDGERPLEGPRGERPPAITGAHKGEPGAIFAPSGGFEPARATSPGAKLGPATLTAPAAPELAPERLLPAPRELVLTLPAGEDGSLTRVHVRDHNGAVEVAVRTSDSQLSHSLQDGLPDLVRHLESPGFAASATRGDSPEDSSYEGQSNEGQSYEGQNQPREGRDGSGDHARGQPGEQRRERLARWRESLGLS